MSNVLELLLRDQGSSWFALIDAAALSDGRAGLRRRGFADMACLFDGDQEREHWDVAPYLARLPTIANLPKSMAEALDELAQAGALMLVAANADAGLVAMKRHFKKFTLMYLPDGSPALCRFYDPRVMRDLWPILDSTQRQAFLLPLEALLLPPDERHDAAYLCNE